MNRALEKIKKNFDNRIRTAATEDELESIKQEFLGSQGALKRILDLIKTLPQSKRHSVKDKADNLEKYFQQVLVKKAKNSESSSRLDISLPGKKISQGHIHPLTQALLNIERVFESMGFSIFLAPELETEFYNFDALNIPEDHPARDLWDTFWLKGSFVLEDVLEKTGDKEEKPERLLLRTHTTAMQLRYMEKHNPPFRIITPGRCFRYEASDSSHDIQFYQIDGLIVDQNISIANFKAIITELFKRLFSSSIRIRIRPGYFPFVEPGFEIDISRYNAGDKSRKSYGRRGDAHNIESEEDKWLEIMGAGMVHPEVFKKAGYNPVNWQGFAFGMGVDRIAMIKYGISDIRLFYQNDLRFLKQF